MGFHASRLLLSQVHKPGRQHLIAIAGAAWRFVARITLGNAAITASLSSGANLAAGASRCRSRVAGIAGAVGVTVRLRRVSGQRAVVSHVQHAVLVGVVAGVANPVPVGVGLARVGSAETVILPVRNPVRVCVWGRWWRRGRWRLRRGGRWLWGRRRWLWCRSWRGRGWRSWLKGDRCLGRWCDGARGGSCQAGTVFRLLFRAGGEAQGQDKAEGKQERNPAHRDLLPHGSDSQATPSLSPSRLNGSPG